MPLLGKIVVIKRNGEDGTEFPLTASCLFGRKLNCDIRIQLPQVSKEHCRIELNENKELILTNLSSVNPTLINGEVLHQSDRLKNGDLITIIDRSFRFEFPPPKTPKKKRLSSIGKDKTPQEKGTPVPVEKRKSEHSFDTCLKDGSNLPQPLEQTVEMAADEKPKKNSMSPFGELYQMVKQDLATKSPWKSGVVKTPLARPQVNHEELEVTTDVKRSPEQVMTPPAKRRRSSKVSIEDNAGVVVPQSTLEANPAEDASVESSIPSPLEKSATPVSQKKRTPSKTPEKFSAGEVVQQILLEPQSEEKTSKSPKGRRSSGAQNQMSSSQPQTPTAEKNTDSKPSPRTSPRSNAGKRFEVQDVPSESVTLASEDKDTTSVKDSESQANVTILKSKRKRVSFGGQLSPELFDKRLPPNSPLRRGATPRRSLGLHQKSQSLLRRASTIGLMALRLDEMVPESSKLQKSPAKKASPKREAAVAKSPSPAKKSPSTKAKTPSPKTGKSPSGTPKTPSSSRRSSTSKIASNGSVLETPTVQGRFSVSRIDTPSPVQDQMEESKGEQVAVKEDVPQVFGTPKIPLRRKSMKSARKTPKSAIKSALDVVRSSRRSGASRANLKVLNSWADIVKFGQTKSQTEITTKKTTKSKMVKKTVVSKPKTPARRLKDEISTGHAASPVTIVVGKAHLRTNQSVGAAPKIVPNLALFKKDMKMDEDLTGVADIFKTPAKTMVAAKNACTETPLDEFSVMKTPEESGEMMVSPLSVISTTKHEIYSNEAVSRLLLDNQDDEGDLSQTADNLNDTDEPVEMSEQTEEEQGVPEPAVKTPKQAIAPSSCLTGVKRLMKTPKQKAEPIEDLRGKLLKTPKQKAEPIEDLRGKLLKTPKAPKLPQEEILEGVKELLKTPKHRGVAVEDMVGVKRVMQTPKEKNSPVLCASALKRLMKTPQDKSDQDEDLTVVKEPIQTPKLTEVLVEDELDVKEITKAVKPKKTQAEEDLTGIQQLMKTPKHRGQPVEREMGVKRLMQTPKEKVESVEDLTGVKQLMKTPKHRGQPVEREMGIKRLMQTPKEKVKPVEDFTGVKQLMKTPRHKETPAKKDLQREELVEEPVAISTLTTQDDVTELEVQEPEAVVEIDSAIIPAEVSDMECDKENVCQAEPMESEVLKSVDLQCTAASVDPQLMTEVVIPEKDHTDQIEEESVSVQVTDGSSEEDVKNKESEAMVCVSDNSVTSEATESSSTAEEEVTKSSVASKTQRGVRGRAASKSKAPAVLSLIDECGPPPSSPVRGRRGKKLVDVPEVAASPARKSARGRVPKHSSVDEEMKDTQAPVESTKTEVSDCQPAVTKTKRGKNAEKDCDEIQTSDAQVGDEEPIQAPVPKAGRRVNNKMESQPSEEQKQITEVDSEANAVAPDDVSMQTSEAPEAPPVAATRARKGRTTKKEVLKTEPTQTSENDLKTTDTVVAEKPLASVPKSGRGRLSKKETAKNTSLDEETKDAEAVQAPVEATKPEVSDCQPAVTKTKRGRNAQKDCAEIQSTNAQVGNEEPIQVPVPKAGRRRVNNKMESQPSEEQNQIPEVLCEENVVEPDDVNLQTSEAPEAPLAATRARKGRTTKKEVLKTEPTQTSENDLKTTDDVVAEKPLASVPKSGRGRLSKKETAKDNASEVDVKVDSQEDPEAPVVKSCRGRRTKQQQPQIAEVEIQVRPIRRGRQAKESKENATAEVDIQAPVVVTEEQPAKQSKENVSVEAEENIASEVEQAEVPVVKSVRKRGAAAKEVEIEVPVKRGRRAVIDPTPAVAVVSSRGRKAITKVEPEVTEDSASSEEQVKPVKHSKRTAKISECVENTEPEKVVRGNRSKKEMILSKDAPKNTNESATVQDNVGKTSKMVQWSSALVVSKDIEEIEPSDVKEAQLPKSKKSSKISTETDHTADQPSRVCRGRGANKIEESSENCPEEVQIKGKPLRRGKAVTSGALKSEPDHIKAATPLKRKRKEIEVSEDPENKEPLPKRRGRTANSTEVSIKEKGLEAEPMPLKNTKRTRVQNKTAQEPDPEPAPTQETVSVPSTRKGRSVKKTEEVDVSEAAPIRRTRRK